MGCHQDEASSSFREAYDVHVIVALEDLPILFRMKQHPKAKGSAAQQEDGGGERLPIRKVGCLPVLEINREPE